MFENKVAYITGGTKGIGFGIAKILLQNGINVAITGRKKADVDYAVSELSPDSSKILGKSSSLSA